jgi:hypothetical protein
VKKAVDASYRDKPSSRPGFPGGPPREVPSKPGFPSAGAEPATGQGQEGRAVAGGRSVSIGRDAVGSSIVAGNSNVVAPTYTPPELPQSGMAR